VAFKMGPNFRASSVSPEIFSLPIMNACRPSNFPAAMAKKSSSCMVMVVAALPPSPRFVDPLPFFRSMYNFSEPTFSWKTAPPIFTRSFTRSAPLDLTAASIWSKALALIAETASAGAMPSGRSSPASLPDVASSSGTSAGGVANSIFPTDVRNSQTSMRGPRADAMRDDGGAAGAAAEAPAAFVHFMQKLLPQGPPRKSTQRPFSPAATMLSSTSSPARLRRSRYSCCCRTCRQPALSPQSVRLLQSIASGRKYKEGGRQLSCESRGVRTHRLELT